MSTLATQPHPISKLLFESAILLLILLVVVQFVLIAVWSRWRTRSWYRAVWVGFMLVVALPLLSIVVVTGKRPPEPFLTQPVSWRAC